jgi:hypothetical protein
MIGSGLHVSTRMKSPPDLPAASQYPQLEFRGETRLTHRPPVELAPKSGAGPARTEWPFAEPGLHSGYPLSYAARTGSPAGTLLDRRVGLGFVNTSISF